MNHLNRISYRAIFLTFTASFILSLLPMPEWATWFQPAWVLMVLVFWIMEIPYCINIGTAWLIGIVLDVLNGAILGEHALALTVVAYCIVKIQSQLRMFPILQQALCVLVFGLIYQFILFCIQGFLGAPPKTWMYWLSSFTSMLLWPWVYIILRDIQARFTV